MLVNTSNLKKLKKLLSVLIISILVINTKKEVLKKIIYIYYAICFLENNNNIKTLINSSGKINTINHFYTLKLSL